MDMKTIAKEMNDRRAAIREKGWAIICLQSQAITLEKEHDYIGVAGAQVYNNYKETCEHRTTHNFCVHDKAFPENHCSINVCIEVLSKGE